MKITLSLCISLFFLSSALSQDLLLTPIEASLCQPGVIHKSPTKGLLLEYDMTPNIQLRDPNAFATTEPTKIGFSKRFKMKLKAPLIIKENLKVIAGWNYYSEEYKFDYIGAENLELFSNINDKHLKSSSLTLSVIKPINNKYYFAVKADASFNGDYDGMFNFDQKYASYRLATIFGVKKRADLEWGVGLLFRHGFDTNLPVLPFGVYNQTFNSKWGIEAIIPSSIKGRYNINNKNILLFGPEFDSRIYAINDVAATAESYVLKRSEIRFAVNYQRHLGSWFWLELSTGYAHNLTTNFEVDQFGGETGVQNFNTSGSPFFKVGVFVSPSSQKASTKKTKTTF